MRICDHCRDMDESRIVYPVNVIVEVPKEPDATFKIEICKDCLEKLAKNIKKH